MFVEARAVFARQQPQFVLETAKLQNVVVMPDLVLSLILFVLRMGLVR